MSRLFLFSGSEVVVRVSCFGFLSGFRVPDSGFWVPGSGFHVSSFGLRVSGSRFRVPHFGFEVSGSRFRGSGFGLWEVT